MECLLTRKNVFVIEIVIYKCSDSFSFTFSCTKTKNNASARNTKCINSLTLSINIDMHQNHFSLFRIRRVRISWCYPFASWHLISIIHNN